MEDKLFRKVIIKGSKAEQPEEKGVLDNSIKGNSLAELMRKYINLIHSTVPKDTYQFYSLQMTELRDKIIHFQSPSEQSSVTDEEIAIEILARFHGNSRGMPIARRGFIDGAKWMRSRFLNK
jgi:hypothetical protein